MEPASRILGNADDEVISLRRDYATVLFEGGDYRRAASQHRQLARDLAARRGADDEQVLHHRLQEATCHALIGETSQAGHAQGEVFVRIKSVFFDVGETIVDETREYGTWADWLGVPRHTFAAVFGAVIATGRDYRETFQVFRPGFDRATERQRRADAGHPEWFSEDDLYPDTRPCLRG